MYKNNSFEPFSLCCGSRLLRCERPAVMGILNVTPDSFYDGNRYLSEKEIVERAQAITSEGADIIDIGVVSTRPGATLLAPEDRKSVV